MESAKGKNVLVSGASIAGISTAYWLHKLGYRVTVVELAAAPRTGGAAINIQGEALASAQRMGILAQLKAHRLNLERLEFKNAADETESAVDIQHGNPQPADVEVSEVEIERVALMGILVAALQNEVEFLFDNRITALAETADAMQVTFQHGAPRAFDLVFGCDGMHSGVRKLWFGHEAEYAHFLEHYFSLTIVERLLIAPNTAQLYSVPGKGIMLNAYQGKTDIIFWFFAAQEIPYDYRNAEQQRQLVAAEFAGQGWRSDELLAEIKGAGISYFDKFCQIKMPSWTKGRVALVGDAAYCASPAAGIGASLSMMGAAAVAEALEQHDGDFAAAFAAYNQSLRPFVEETQAMALHMLHNVFIPKTEEAIRKRNTEGMAF